MRIEPVYCKDAVSDSQFRSFCVAVEKTLALFETVTEWADIIGFLSRLGKLLVSGTHGLVPKKTLLAKRLTQCLNPALPSGVHQKTLEVYALVFQVCHRDQLAEDLMLWGSGLFPFAHNASTLVKPALLSLYETIGKLGPGLRPHLKPFLLGVVSFLEEEGNEFFERALSLLDATVESVQPFYFYQSLWLTPLTSPHIRLSLIHYLSKRMPSISTPENFVALLNNNTLISRALACLLEDKVPLVKRGTLEILVNQVPMHEFLFCRIEYPILVRAAISVVLSRDMSLNRRLYAWILKDSTLTAKSISYLSDALVSMIQSPSDDPLELTKPFRIMTSLLDKPELGQPIIETVFVEVLRGLESVQSKDPKIVQEVTNSILMLFGMLDGFLTWQKLFSLTSSIENMELLLFAVEKLPSFEDEAQRIHLPFFHQQLCHLLVTLLNRNTLDTDWNIASALIHLTLQIVKKITPPVFQNSWNLRDFRGLSKEFRKQSFSQSPTSALSFGRVSQVASITDPLPEESIKPSIEQVKCLYESVNDPTKSEKRKQLFMTLLVGRPAMDSATSFLFQFMDGFLNQVNLLINPSKDLHRLWIQSCEIITLYTNVSREPILPSHQWISRLVQLIKQSHDFYILKATFTTVQRILIHDPKMLPPSEFESLTRSVALKLWNFFDPRFVELHTQAMTLYHSLETMSSTAFLESVLSQEIQSLETPLTLHFQKLGIFWRLKEDKSPHLYYSRLLFRVFDALSSPNLDEITCAETWICSHVTSTTSLVVPLSIMISRYPVQWNKDSILVSSQHCNATQIRWGLHTLLTLLKLDSLEVTKMLWKKRIDLPWIQSHFEWVGDHPGTGKLSLHALNYAEAILILLLRFILVDEVESMETTDIKVTSLCLLETLTSTDHFAASQTLGFIYESFLIKLLELVRGDKRSFQPFLIKSFQKVCLVFYRDPGLSADTFQYKEPLFNVLLEAVSTQSNRCNLQAWLVLVSFHLPALRDEIEGFLKPFVQVVVDHIENYRGQLASSHSESVSCTATMDVQMVAFLGLMDQLVVTCLSPIEIALPTILTRVSSPSAPLLQNDIVFEFPRLFFGVVRVLSLLTLNAYGYIADRVHRQMKKLIESLYSLVPGQLVEILVLTWYHENQVTWLGTTSDLGSCTLKLFEWIPEWSHTLLIRHLVDSLKDRLSKEPNPKNYVDLDTDKILVFIELYLAHQTVSQVSLFEIWPCLHSYFKEVCSHANSFKNLFPLLLRVITRTILCTQSIEFEDKKLKRELGETFVKITDYAIYFCASAMDHGPWKRSEREELKDGSIHFEDGFQRPSDEIIGQHLARLFAQTIVPNLKNQILSDPDRVLTILGNMMTYLINPILKNRLDPTRLMALPLLQLLQAICSIPVSSKLWKKEVWDAFMDSRFFSCTPESLAIWKTIIFCTIQADKDRFDSLLSRAMPSSSSIFSSKEQENLVRASSIKRLSFVIHSCPLDFFQPQLPALHERLVDIFKSSNESLQLEGFLLIRVLTRCISSKHLSNIWQVTLNELVFHVFSSALQDPDRLKALSKPLFQSCLLVLEQTLIHGFPEFQYFQSLFISEPLLQLSMAKPTCLLDYLKSGPTSKSSFKSFDRPFPIKTLADCDGFIHHLEDIIQGSSFEIELDSEFLEVTLSRSVSLSSSFHSHSDLPRRSTKI